MVYGGGIGSGCLTNGRMTMSATLLHQNDDYVGEGDINLNQYGTWVKSQDPLTGQIISQWKPFDKPTQTPETPWPDGVDLGTIPCIARGIVDGGIRVAGTTERFGDTYENIDYVKMWVPAHVKSSFVLDKWNIKVPCSGITAVSACWTQLLEWPAIQRRSNSHY